MWSGVAEELSPVVCERFSDADVFPSLTVDMLSLPEWLSHSTDNLYLGWTSVHLKDLIYIYPLQ